MNYSYEHKRTVYERTLLLYESEEFVDIEFIWQDENNRGRKIKCHRLLFAIASPVFKAMMFGGLHAQNYVVIEDFEPNVFETMKRYIYTDIVRFESLNHAIEVYKAADKYDMPFLLKEAELYIMEESDICDLFSLLEFTELYDNYHIEDTCMDVIINHTRDVFHCDTFPECSPSVLYRLLDQGDLNINEIDLFYYIEYWVCDRLRGNRGDPYLDPMMANIVNKIRFLCMTHEEFRDGPMSSILLTEEEKNCLYSYLCKPGSVELPQRFSKLTTYRKPNIYPKQIVTILVTWEVKFMCGCAIYQSNTFYLCNMPWKMILTIHILNGVKWISIALKCYGDESIERRNWFCKVYFRCTMVAQNDDCEDYRRAFKKVRLFNADVDEWGWTQFIEWSRLFDPNNGFVIDYTTVIEGDLHMDYD